MITNSLVINLFVAQIMPYMLSGLKYMYLIDGQCGDLFFNTIEIVRMFIML